MIRIQYSQIHTPKVSIGDITKKVKAVSTSEHLFTFGKSSFVSLG